MYIIFFALIFSVCLISLLPLVILISRLSFLKRLFKGKRLKLSMISILIAIVVTVILSLSMSFVNAIICILHLDLIWALLNLIAFAIQKLSKKSFKNYYTALISVVVTFAYLSFGYYNAHNIIETHYDIESSKDINSLRIAQIADAHLGAIFSGSEFEEYVSEINSHNPDVVFITGDFVDDNTSVEDLENGCKALSAFEATYGVYYVYGNHDKGMMDENTRGWNKDYLDKLLTENGVEILEDESLLINNEFYIIGRQDYSVERENERKSSIELTEHLDKSKYMIVLDHQPHDYSAQAESEVDLVLSGHTHGGQLFPVNQAGEWLGMNCRTYGHEKIMNTDFIVTSGIACWEILFKTGCYSEYVIIDVNK